MQGAHLILPTVHVMKRGKNSAHVTGILLPSLLEQLIASGASKIVITDPDRYKDALPDLPDIYNHYIVVSNNHSRATLVVSEILEPIYEELGIEFLSSGAFSYKQIFLKENTKAANDAMVLSFELIDFFTALFCKAQFHSDISALSSRLSCLFKVLRSDTARANLACLAPIFQSYKRIEVAGVKVIAAPNTELSERLSDIIRSGEFSALSKSRHSLGVGTSLKIAASELKHYTKKLLAIKPAKAAIDYSSKAISVTSGIPIPTSELAQGFLSEAFLPPALDLSQQIANAKHNFLRGTGGNDSNDFIGI